MGDVPKLSVIEWTCLAYGVSEPGEWTNQLIWEDLGGPDAGTNTRVIHAVAKLRRLGFVEPNGGYRIPLSAPLLKSKEPIAAEVLSVVSDRQPISLADIRRAVVGDNSAIGKAVKDLTERGVVVPPNHIWPTQDGIDTLAARPKNPTTTMGRPRRRQR